MSDIARIDAVRFGGEDWRRMVALRDRVLRAPLGLAYSTVQLDEEHDQIHLALWSGDALVGTLLLVPPSGEGGAKLRQMAIDPGWQGRGLGARLVRHGEGVLARLGAAEVRLSARESALRFYQRLGYAAYGARFVEVTIPHRAMRKARSCPSTWWKLVCN